LSRISNLGYPLPILFTHQCSGFARLADAPVMMRQIYLVGTSEDLRRLPGLVPCAKKWKLQIGCYRASEGIKN